MITEAKGLQITGNIKPGFEEILHQKHFNLLNRLERHFGGRRKELLEKRKVIQDGTQSRKIS